MQNSNPYGMESSCILRYCKKNVFSLRMAFEVKRYGDGTHLMTPGPPLMTPGYLTMGYQQQAWMSLTLVTDRKRRCAFLCLKICKTTVF